MSPPPVHPAMPPAPPPATAPFSRFLEGAPEATPLRAAVTAAYRAPEAECVARLLPDATLPPALAARAEALARRLVGALRDKGARGMVEGLVQEFSLSSQEGVALMCLAEALLRIPDTATRDALIRDKIGNGDWRAHLGHSPSIFVNAATWGLVVTGRLASSASESGLSGALTRLIARGGEPVIRRGVDLAMRMMGEQFVTGQTIAEALARSRLMEAKGFRYSYDMLGEAATTAEDAARYHRDYETAIHAIGQAAGGRGVYEGPGISVKLSALHPRYLRAQRGRVMAELLPRLAALAALAKRYDIGLNIDAEEADRLELSLDLLEALCHDPALAGWDGLGFVVQAYQKRAPFVLDVLIDLARRSGHRLMVRLVKGAYWDSEIKRAQMDGLEDFPVFTRKAHTDVSYLACARKLLAAREHVFPQFATHNAQTLASLHALAGEEFRPGDWEFQCLHGMGEPLYEEVVGPERLDRPCRIYAPVGTHETLLAYLVRRLLENGANSSFVHRIQDSAIAVDELVTPPAEVVAREAEPGTPHPRIARPRDLFGAERRNSAGFDPSDEDRLAALADALRDSAARDWRAAPRLATATPDGAARAVLNPADHGDRVGEVTEAGPAQIDRALADALAAAPGWAATPAAGRAACLRRAADMLEAERAPLLGLLIREAGKSLANAVAEVREAVDFLRYYAARAERELEGQPHRPLGPVTCISPWNFPLAIFAGQVTAALAAGNPVLAKPAEETPLIAAQAVAILHAAGIPPAVLQLLPGDGRVGAALVADPRTRGVMFTGSTAVAKRIAAELARRLNPDGAPVPLVAETGGQNAMIVDSSALAEQVVGDVLLSAFDSAGQRCSALRVLCLQEDVADRILAMLRGALAELSVGNPDRLATDIGPVISAEARDGLLAHVARMREAGHSLHQAALPAECARGTFVPPTIIEIGAVADLTQEVFGPVLHVLRFRRDRLEAVIEAVNATGYGLTFGVHSRLDETIERATARARAGNIYVNRNMIGAVVGVQPFGGHGLSGTGPKAGGPLTLRRLLAEAPAASPLPAGRAPEAARLWAAWLARRGEVEAAARAEAMIAATPLGIALDLPGPVGEHNRYGREPRGTVLCLAGDAAERFDLVSAALATGNRAGLEAGVPGELPGDLPDGLAGWIVPAASGAAQAVLVSGDDAAVLAAAAAATRRTEAVIPLHRYRRGGPAPLELLVQERSVSTNTAAAGGNANLMMLG
ncbi:trifunctional transcriptional regulator/proline dehydrogenase/L-glutamate gamma-semialdehyde dehydrogenase [Roseomonas sp. OT10]|uniref:trifunctional transcriptional regulator/proline dehydrogenase/L-glutamate gamma-semialdehyde dehydrogenase n=1 Tax=Roseomonas cutis TaxID=2897332 RepID=UPI001E4E669B|nr:trifunctional transcriptional regulator/proline dehydrogenase/L-glutamate gamma-semialdehyde dehydrogenase [Roseomonas sp. OT10]UFN49474.1 trifunctional transcriptional regulator/proline dehydrogenase/L-glutamate gamma-semialdehyde dehydrogenase [Roseomonas sp. OT10]